MTQALPHVVEALNKEDGCVRNTALEAMVNLVEAAHDHATHTLLHFVEAMNSED